eukprot:gnl/MRDRNA2_/MRDRNA2_35408_c0_seq1.p1 gnl/MRDRNA2_/MRDRNA2_35408_c0~~gnl/MRDRNA2_/MRDRNA2_35408_c0_seq1.p1  ORF type:complete len:231 (-),score=40.49 gnl/MRDRNA2_/MRDRNA2_35408_c0_seq1:220-912(-)
MDAATDVRVLMGTAYAFENPHPVNTSCSIDEGIVEVSSALGPCRLGVQSHCCEFLLDLGMGNGRVALQCFLECQCIKRVVGVEIKASRFGAARIAIGKLVEANPARFHVENTQSPGFPIISVLHDGQRKLEIWLGDLLTIPAEEIRVADAIIAQMSPERELDKYYNDGNVRQDKMNLQQIILGAYHKREKMQALLHYAKDGCRMIGWEQMSFPRSDGWSELQNQNAQFSL